MPILTGAPGGAGSWRMQQFSFAYVKAVASAADCAVEHNGVDVDSVDLTLKWKSNAGPIRSPRLEVQVKSTHQRCVGPQEVKYQLKGKNYEELSASNLAIPRILVVLTMPRMIEKWVVHSETELTMRKCAYWCSLRGAQPLGDKKSKLVGIPREQVFDVAGLNGIYERLASGRYP